ncbi:MAG: PAS domain S-box protein [archaeon]
MHFTIVAEKAKRTEAEKKCAYILQNTSDSIFMVDVKTQKIVEVNKSAQILLGYTKKQLLSKTIKDLHPKTNLRETMAIFTHFTISPTKVLKTELEFVDSKDQVFNTSATIDKMRLDNKDYLIGIFRRV